MADKSIDWALKDLQDIALNIARAGISGDGERLRSQILALVQSFAGGADGSSFELPTGQVPAVVPESTEQRPRPELGRAAAPAPARYAGDVDAYDEEDDEDLLMVVNVRKTDPEGPFTADDLNEVVTGTRRSLKRFLGDMLLLESRDGTADGSRDLVFRQNLETQPPMTLAEYRRNGSRFEGEVWFPGLDGMVLAVGRTEVAPNPLAIEA